MITVDVEDYATTVASASALRIRGEDTKAVWRMPSDSKCTLLDMRGCSGIVDFSPNDQVVAVRGGTSLHILQQELQEHGQCLPIVAWHDGWHVLVTGTLAGHLSMNLPHELDAECGSWRDWVIGMTLILADGTIAKSGSHAVKSVAGYDIHKLMIGARGTLAVIVEVILRTYPLKSLPTPKVNRCDGDFGMQISGPVSDGGKGSLCFQRVQPNDFEQARLQRGFGGQDFLSSSTLFRVLPPQQTLRRYPGDWVIRSGQVNIEDPTMVEYMKRTKAILDPTGKLNPGEFGIF